MRWSCLFGFTIGLLVSMACSAENLAPSAEGAAMPPSPPVPTMEDGAIAKPAAAEQAIEQAHIGNEDKSDEGEAAVSGSDGASSQGAPSASEAVTPAPEAAQAEPKTDSSVVLPGLPLSVTDPKPRNKATSTPMAMMSQAPLKMTVEPGRTIFLDVALNQMNRFITPWKKPRIVSAHEVTHYVRGNAVYIAPSSNEPLGIYITSGDESQAISLGLFPKAIPPREVTLEMPGIQVSSASEEAMKWETSTDYLTTITQLLEDTAHGNIPPGYGLRQPNERDAHYVCDMPGLNISAPLQVLDGGHLAVHIMKVTNTGALPVEAQEHTCLQDGVAAAAVSPPAVLEAGETREMYLVVKMGQDGFQTQVRPRVDK